MSGLLPVAVYGLEVPAGDIITPAVADFPGTTFRITMAAVEPNDATEPPKGAPRSRATLKFIRRPPGLDDYDEDDDSEGEPDSADFFDAMLSGAYSEDEDDLDESSDDEEDINGGPSDPTKSKKARKEKAVEELRKAIEESGDDDVDMADSPNGVNGTKVAKKGKAVADLEDDEDEDDDDDDEGEEMEEFVICTLDPYQHYQQTLDLTIGEDDEVFFKVSGNNAVYLTGNYVVPAEDGPGRGDDLMDSDQEDYDLSPDEDELDEDEDESDDLDDLEDPRITELGSDDEEEIPKLVKAKEQKKGKNKRAAESSEDEPSNLDDLINKSQKDGAAPEQKLSKKQQKKLKTNAGDAVASKQEVKPEAKNDKKVQFAKNLEQGPAAKKEEQPAAPSVKTVQGVTLDDRKVGKGPAAKKGDRVSMRYIGKLEANQRQFDANKSGKPFSFKLGAGEVIKGWDIGVAGMRAGSERRITIPANLAYGSKALPGIPANSSLIFDVKLLDIK